MRGGADAAMRVIPVLDVRGGVAVHARGGDRTHYGPLSSVWHPGSADPRTLAAAYARKYRDHAPLGLYLADLVAIEGRAEPDLALYRDLAAEGLMLWVDAGARRADDCAAWLGAGVEVAVLGLETIAELDELGRAVNRYGPRRVLFSLDLRAGRPMGDPRRLGCSDDPALIAERVFMIQGIRQILVLDVARVGSGRGIARSDLARRMAADDELDVYVGGGVGSRSDLEVMRRAGVAGALVGSAIHDGRLEPRDPTGWGPEPA